MVVLKTRSQAKNFVKRMNKQYKKLDVPYKNHTSEQNFIYIDPNRKRVIHMHSFYVEGCSITYTANVIGVLKYKL
jgi:hypothetical protein